LSGSVLSRVLQFGRCNKRVCFFSIMSNYNVKIMSALFGITIPLRPNNGGVFAVFKIFIKPDIVDLRGRREKPGNPETVKTKKGLRTFPADSPTSWQVGYRIGAALRRAYYAAEPAPAGEGAASEKIKERSSPRPHIRRAHWHSYWTGPRKGKREAILKWLPPIPVGAGELVPTIHLVEKEKAPAD
jgi:hypothetical protein